MKKIEEYFENGKIRTEGFTDDSNHKQGRWMTYFESGQLFKEENYLNDKRNGILKRWYENGQIALEIELKDDKYDGPWREYYENGTLKEEGNYENSEYVVRNFWDEKGNQTLINGSGFKIEKYGAFELDVYKQYFENYKFVKEEKISSLKIIDGFKERDENI